MSESDDNPLTRRTPPTLRPSLAASAARSYGICCDGQDPEFEPTPAPARLLRRSGTQGLGLLRPFGYRAWAIAATSLSWRFGESGTDRDWPVLIVNEQPGPPLLGYKGFGQQGFRTWRLRHRSGKSANRSKACRCTASTTCQRRPCPRHSAGDTGGAGGSPAKVVEGCEAGIGITTSLRDLAVAPACGRWGSTAIELEATVVFGRQPDLAARPRQQARPQKQ